MSRRLRRLLVSLAVVASLIVGWFSIRTAADLAAAAAPPPAPPISMQALRAALEQEQARADALQTELDDLLGATGDLTTAIDATKVNVTADGETAAQLRARLKAAEERLKVLTRLLKEASARLAALGASGPTVPPVKPAGGTSGGGSGGGSGGSAATPPPTPRPTAAAAGFSLTLQLSGGGVLVSWTTCTASGFSGYAVVRSLDSEIHYPPEDRDTLVATLTSPSDTSFADSSAPAGRAWYRVYCLTRRDGETRTAATTNTVSVTVP